MHWAVDGCSLGILACALLSQQPEAFPDGHMSLWQIVQAHHVLQTWCGCVCAGSGAPAPACAAAAS